MVDYEHVSTSTASIISNLYLEARADRANPRKAPAKRAPRVRRICFTLNNYSEEEYQDIIATPCKWMIVAKETGESGTPHLQGAAVLNAQTALSVVKTWPGWTRAHLEDMRGTVSDSITYCSKQDPNAFQKGDPPKPGKRNDIHRVVERVQTERGLWLL
jgi:hypothetical protein